MDFINRLRATWHPERYHGWGRDRRYFEGWYYKLVSAGRQHAMAVIPGISRPESGAPHSFIQVMDGNACRSEYHRFEAGAFRPEADRFEVKVAENLFSGQEIRLDLPGLQGNIRFDNTTPWPKMLGAPGIMGWYSFVPFMQCFHGIVSMHHRLSGSLEYQGQVLDFTGGTGYIEKDWGRSFPKAYVWMQSNHFDATDRVSLVASVAHIPWLGSHFIGFISGFWIEGRLFKFATYTGAKQYLTIGPEQIEIVFKNPKTELRLQARQAPGTALKSPLAGEMTGKVQESLQATIHTELLENGKRIFEGAGRSAGLEVVGPVEELTA